jgi:hypothetical protein
MDRQASPTPPGLARRPETPVELAHCGLSREIEERMAVKKKKTKAENGT